jgi:hypothetical protein
MRQRLTVSACPALVPRPTERTQARVQIITPQRFMANDTFSQARGDLPPAPLRPDDPSPGDRADAPDGRSQAEGAVVFVGQR